MRRHQVVEIEASDHPAASDAVPQGRESDLGDAGDIELIDETTAPEPVLRSDIAGRSAAGRALAIRPVVSAVPSSVPMNPSRVSLPWGLGTDGWPRHNSRLVRLFACDPHRLAVGAAGLAWGPLSLEEEVRTANGERWPEAITGQLQMPYRSPPLEIQLRVQPFHDRYSRVDVVLCSHRRWPRRYFDVASRSLTQMQQLERTSN